MFYSVDISEDFKPRIMASQIALNKQGRSQDIQDFFLSFFFFWQQRAGSLNIKRSLLIKETRYPRLRDLVLFYMWEGAKVWAH